MKANVRFKAKVAIGICGATVLGVDEECFPDWYNQPSAGLDCVKDDILSDGAESWFHYLCVDIPEERGIYKVTGYAEFTEDDSKYSGVKFEAA